VLAIEIAASLTSIAAGADSLEEITIARRGTSTSRLGEGTLPAYHAMGDGVACRLGARAGARQFVVDEGASLVVAAVGL
jgi:hypothetical protein